jgi:hypothetical protein
LYLFFRLLNYPHDRGTRPIIDITKEYQPQFQAHVTLEAPDGERLALTFPGERARTLVHDDVIVLERTPGVPADLPEPAMGEYVIQQSPQSTRRNVLPVKLIDGSLLMRHEHLACALV